MAKGARKMAVMETDVTLPQSGEQHTKIGKASGEKLLVDKCCEEGRCETEQVS